MKKLYLILALILTTLSFAQTPQGFNYQATVRDNFGELVVSQNVNFKFKVIQGLPTNEPLYAETHQNVSTDDLGHVVLVIGDGTPTTGTFSEIDWSLGNYFLGIELDTGSGYVAIGTTQMLSVPYALYAESSGNASTATPNLEAILAEDNSANNQQIKNLADPTDDQDAATKAYTYSKEEVDDRIKTEVDAMVTNKLAELYGYPEGTVFCDGAVTRVVDVTNPATGKTWMDRNLGASQVATSSTDTNAYGDLYQWGRGADGHQCRDSGTTSTLSSTDQPGHGDFIYIGNSFPYDWLSKRNDNLWQGADGVNNPCPSGYRLPTEAELIGERDSWGSKGAAGAFASPLKLPMAGIRSSTDGELDKVGTQANYWGSTVRVTSPYASYLIFTSSSISALAKVTERAYGLSVRCIKD